MVSQRRKTVLVTGCSEGGIGHALVDEFQSRGLHVFATARFAPYSGIHCLSLTSKYTAPGFYAGTKSALISISEGTRPELKPSGVKLPPDSLYKGAEEEIAARATGQDVGERLGTTTEDSSRELVGKLLSGASGRLHVGNMSTMIRIVTTWLPTCVVEYLTVTSTGLDYLPTLSIK
ncbi:hypothetical protein F5Y00DRAFT_258973 [Daldinia vernicosa]|uniref:uncharacterized protein n=1 Tax=Daldinia vernicosa TaxID=114800 RepID=UPI0020085A54|nr:uncharacterized protein F5Y00DRAFT_258973 [Daldinia vernicosa]KAI0852016.1 hypothetical protein F5Y00DRAFT_258973 [Daldinia vernicosa]